MPRRFLALSALAVLPLLPALLRADDSPKGDKDLDGTWETVSAIRDGKDLPQPADGKIVITVAGDSLTIKVGDAEHKAAIVVDASKTPRTLDVIPEDGAQKGKTMKAIYEVKGDQLKVCHGDPDAERPKELASKEGSGLVLTTLKRVKK